MWSRDELGAVARLCVKHDVTLCSDEVWGECVLEPEATPFIGMGALCAEVEGLRERLIVISSPSKVFNVACTDIAYAAIPGEALRRAFIRVGADKAEVTPFGFAVHMDPSRCVWIPLVTSAIHPLSDH